MKREREREGKTQGRRGQAAVAAVAAGAALGNEEVCTLLALGFNFESEL